MVRAPAVGSIAFARGVRNRGFLHFAGDLWREHGDVFEAHIGPRRLVFVMHPDAVEQVTVSGRQRYDKKGSYDGARRYLIGQGLVGSTGDLWRRQRKLIHLLVTNASWSCEFDSRHPLHGITPAQTSGRR